jgi:hypothetical protein
LLRGAGNCEKKQKRCARRTLKKTRRHAGPPRMRLLKMYLD